MELKNRKIDMFRCHIDPAIGARAKNAFKVGNEGILEAELTPIGVWVKWVNQSPGNLGDTSENVVPFSNVQSIKLRPIPKDDKE